MRPPVLPMYATPDSPAACPLPPGFEKLSLSVKTTPGLVALKTFSRGGSFAVPVLRPSPSAQSFGPVLRRSHNAAKE